jgi:hypothetical protein
MTTFSKRLPLDILTTIPELCFAIKNPSIVKILISNDFDGAVEYGFTKELMLNLTFFGPTNDSDIILACILLELNFVHTGSLIILTFFEQLKSTELNVIYSGRVISN